MVRPMSEQMPEISETIIRQIENAGISNDRPVVIADADEVLFQFMAKFLEFLEANGMHFDWSSFALTGNIRNAETNEVVEAAVVKELMPAFFERHAADMSPVEGAAETLGRLSERAQVVILSNVPLDARDDRIVCLKNNDLDYPLIANEGSKGPVVKSMLQGRGIPAVFIDDIPHNHSSVAKHAEDVLRLHFIAHPGLAEMIGKAEHAHHRANDWAEIEGHIHDHLNRNGF